MKEKTVNIAFAFLISIVILCRFISVFVVPDVFCDEVEIINHITSLIENQTDAQGNKFPLFSKVGGGLATYTYLYPMAILCTIFKVSAIRMRIVQQVLTILACFLTSFSMQILYKNKSLSKILLFVLLTLPWGFVQANRIWDPAFVPIYFSVYFFFFAILLSGKNIKGNDLSVKEKNIFSVFAFSFLVFLAVVYPPCRIVAVGMWIFSILYLLKEKKIEKRQIILATVFCTIFSLPLAIKLFDPKFNERAVSLLIFQKGRGGVSSLFQWLKNFSDMISPAFFFVSGDSNYRHCIPYGGVLGTISAIPIFYSLRQKIDKNMTYMVFIILLSFLSTALTNEGMPHSLRSCLAWMPSGIFISFYWQKIVEKSKKSKFLCFSLMGIFFILYFLAYMRFYINLGKYF